MLLDSAHLAILATSYLPQGHASRAVHQMVTKIAAALSTIYAKDVPKDPFSTLKEYVLSLTHHALLTTNSMVHAQAVILVMK